MLLRFQYWPNRISPATLLSIPPHLHHLTLKYTGFLRICDVCSPSTSVIVHTVRFELCLRLTAAGLDAHSNPVANRVIYLEHS